MDGYYYEGKSYVMDPPRLFKALGYKSQEIPIVVGHTSVNNSYQITHSDLGLPSLNIKKCSYLNYTLNNVALGDVQSKVGEQIGSELSWDEGSKTASFEIGRSGMATNKIRSISYLGKRAIATAEALNSYSVNYYNNIIFLDSSNTTLKEIKPIIVSGESYLTVGFGIYTNDPRMNLWFKEKGIDVSKPLSAKDCKASFEELITGKDGYEESLNGWLDKNPGVLLTQNEYDALIIHRWQSGKLDRFKEGESEYLNTSVLTLLKTKNKNRNDWKLVFNNRRKNSSHTNNLFKRTEWELDIFFDGNYESSNMWFEPLNILFDNLYSKKD